MGICMQRSTGDPDMELPWLDLVGRERVGLLGSGDKLLLGRGIYGGYDTLFAAIDCVKCKIVLSITFYLIYDGPPPSYSYDMNDFDKYLPGEYRRPLGTAMFPSGFLSSAPVIPLSVATLIFNREFPGPSKVTGKRHDIFCYVDSPIVPSSNLLPFLADVFIIRRAKWHSPRRHSMFFTDFSY